MTTKYSEYEEDKTANSINIYCKSLLSILFINLCIINNLFLIDIQHRNLTYQQKEDIYFIRYNR